jgi:hypothetical protein
VALLAKTCSEKYRVTEIQWNLVVYSGLSWHFTSTRFFPLFHLCLTQCKPVTQQVCTRNTYSCSVYNMMQLLCDNDGCVGNSGCHNLPPSISDASDSWLFSGWNAQKFTSGWQAIGAAVCYVLLNMWVSFIMITLCWYFMGTCNTLQVVCLCICEGNVQFLT